MRPSRALAVFLAVLCGLACGVSPEVSFAQQSYAGQTLRVATWGGTWVDAIKKSVGDKFEAATGAKVSYVVGNPPEYATQVIAAHGTNVPFDVIYTDGGTQTDLVQQGLLEKLDSKAVPNVVDPRGFKPLNPGYSPGGHLRYFGIA